MSRETDILDEVIRHQVYLERLASGVSTLVRKRTARLEAVAVDALNASDVIAELSASDFSGLLSEIQANELQVMADAVADLSGHLGAIATYEGDYTAGALRAATRRVRILSLKAGQAYQAALEQPIPATGHLLDAFLDGWSKKQVQAVGNVIGKGYTQGWTNDQIKQAIRGTRANDYSDGLMANVGRNADIVTRTSIQHVSNTARTETWAKNADVVEGYQIVATLDSRTSAICRSMDGKVFELGKGPRPPFHPGCRTTTAPKINDRYAFLDEGATRSAEGGPVPSDLTYYDWLKTQSAGFQADAIGAARAKLLRDGGLSADQFAKLNLGRNFEPMTLDEMRAKEPEAFKRAGL